MLSKLTVGQEGASYSAAVIAEGRFAFISGHGPLTDGNLVPGTIEEQTTLTLSNLLKTVEAAGAGKENIVRCNCYLANISDFRSFDAAYRSFFGARSRHALRLAPPSLRAWWKSKPWSRSTLDQRSEHQLNRHRRYAGAAA